MTPNNVKGLLKDKGFCIIKGYQNIDRDKLIDICQNFGELEEYIDEKKKHKYIGHKHIFEVDGSQETNAVRGRGELPIHADGGLLKKQIDIIALYAAKMDGMKFQGGTGIIDFKLALEEMPLHLRRVLEEEKFETLGLEEPYYSNASSEDWLHIPVLTDLGWTKKCVLYFNYEDEKLASWKTRIQGFSHNETRNFFTELIKYLKSPHYCYLHFWKQDDLLLMDNRRCIHYREPFSKDGERINLRLQMKYD
ncbi:spore coat [Brachionus plicatilis]|uniref:Spore coat n=1 Tax=Brachionus plicatilis TaxID=10195 RepID=A0A3M7PRL5_BRAPC|nr:spore coat [Brachionus plicatilis]